MSATALILFARSGRPWRSRGAVPIRARALLLAAAVLGVVINLSLFAALERTTVATVLITFYIYPAIVALASWRLFGEPLEPARIGALLLALGGLLLVVVAPALASGTSGPGGPAGTGPHVADSGVSARDLVGIGCALTAALAQAAYSILSERGYPTVRAGVTSTIVLAIDAVVFLAIVMLLGHTRVLASPFEEPQLWPWVAVAATIGAAIPTAAIITATRIVGPTRTSILMTLEPVVAVVLAAALLSEPPAPLQLVGGAAVLAAVILVQRGHGAPVMAAHEVPERS